MEQYHEQACAQGVPCALHNYLFTKYGKNAVGGLPKEECVAAFQYWVDNHRSDPSAYRTKEHLMCPMLWCRDTFGNGLETMNHLPTCRWLSDSWYWCPSCSRPETFMDCGGTGGQVPLQRKDSKLRKAMTFFKHFGRRTSVRGKITWPASSAKASEMADTSRYTIEDAEAMDMKSPTEIDSIAKMYELAWSSTHHWPPPELSSRFSHTVQHELPLPDCKSKVASDLIFEAGSQQLSTIQPLCELYDPSTLPAELPSRLSHNVQHELAQPDSEWSFKASPSWMQEKEVGLDGAMPEYTGYEPREIHSSAFRQQGAAAAVELVSPTSGYAPTCDGIVSPLFEDDGNPAVRCRSPLSSRSIKGHFNRPEPICYLAQDRHRLWADMVASTRDTHSQSTPFDRTSQSHDHPLLGDSPFKDHMPYTTHHEISSPDTDGEPVIMQPCIEELRELFFILNHEWLKRLAPFPDLVIRCSSPPVRNLFEIGLTALQHYFSGKVVTSFVEVFALMHIACASAYILHKDDKLYPWDQFFEDMLVWQHAIPEISQSICFVRVMDVLSTPSGVLHLPPRARGASENGSNSASLGSLRKGRVVGVCSMLLAGLDYERLLERNRQLLPAHFASCADIWRGNVERMISQVTQPLQQQSGIEAFRVIVVDIEYRIRSGLLQDPWEVEVALLLDGRNYSQSPQVYQRYREAVSFLCDHAMGNKTNWRNAYYATALDRGIAISLEMDKYRKLESPLLAHWLSLSVLEVLRPIQVIKDASNSNIPADEESSANGSPVSTRSASSMQSSQKSAGESTLTSPATVYSNSTFTTSSPLSPTLRPNEARCEECGKTYTGTSRATNLQRHLKFDRRHNKVASFECLEPGCNSRFSRSDNRSQHIYTAHPIFAALHLRRQGAMKRRRRVDDEVGRERSKVAVGL